MVRFFKQLCICWTNLIFTLLLMVQFCFLGSQIPGQKRPSRWTEKDAWRPKECLQLSSETSLMKRSLWPKKSMALLVQSGAAQLSFFRRVIVWFATGNLSLTICFSGPLACLKRNKRRNQFSLTLRQERKQNFRSRTSVKVIRMEVLGLFLLPKTRMSPDLNLGLQKV